MHTEFDSRHHLRLLGLVMIAPDYCHFRRHAIIQIHFCAEFCRTMDVHASGLVASYFHYLPNLIWAFP